MKYAQTLKLYAEFRLELGQFNYATVEIHTPKTYHFPPAPNLRTLPTFIHHFIYKTQSTVTSSLKPSHTLYSTKKIVS